ncbi:rCG51332, partial [Rattus norvegicus]
MQQLSRPGVQSDPAAPCSRLQSLATEFRPVGPRQRLHQPHCAETLHILLCMASIPACRQKEATLAIK